MLVPRNQFGPQLQAMDPSMSSRAHFHSYGIGPKDEIKVRQSRDDGWQTTHRSCLHFRHLFQDGHQFYTLESLMKQNDIDWIDILKIDVEGAEFT